ncbi:MAG TPA: rod shape-determining protein RodA [Oligoflexia bacterium]|nr:rod shape-determining protein RodA [Oligoflexia bacterium]HMP26724.1 rod shape-determining protein RodA [Oligoflexia bacterium]
MAPVIKKLRELDLFLICLILLLAICGAINLYSAGLVRPDHVSANLSLVDKFLSSPVFVKQLLFYGVGFVIMLIFAFVPSQFWHKIAPYLYGLCLFCLILVFFFGVIQNGSKRWLNIFGFRWQPSEVMKYAVILMTAWIIAKFPPAPKGYTLRELLLPILIIAIPFLFVAKQPDLGTALVLAIVPGAMLIFVGVRRFVLLFSILFLLLVIPLGWNKLHEYQKRRVLTLLNPESDPRGSGYHILQSQIAIGSGRLLGKGFTKGTQSQLEFLPEHSTDFIFSVLAEEWGFVGAFFVILLYGVFILHLYMMVFKTHSAFEALIVFGITTQIFVNFAINLGMVIGFFPVVGIPFPLLSAGGSATISTLLALGIVLNVTRKLRFKELMFA